MLRVRPRLVPFLAVFTLLPAVVCAQSQPAPNPPKEQNAPEHFDSQADHSKRSNETLSDRLDRTKGVIHPPAHVDPEIHETPPPTGDKGIVIPAPPPGSKPEPK